MRNKVLYVEGFNEIPQKVRDYIKRGWTVYNAPRPLLGHDHWQGDFRHGVFFAAVAPEGDPADEFGDAPQFHKRNRENDGHVCEIVSREAVMAYGARIAEKYKVTLADFSYDDIVTSFLHWIETQEAE
jgi:hypothetical protein